ncbi:STAS domain-containing protein [Alkanindiges sp. WGS2144]|uniref:STAS domain-containing protein n=1 Tax=Alkanindiges sp. WGS2144 TaxID=3366808 RepID=UPI0037505102
MSTGHIEYACLNGTHVFKLVGEVRATSCVSLDHLLDKIEQQTDVKGALVDLTRATFIDSTVLGILAKLGLKLQQAHDIQAVMLSTNPDITILADSMGLGQVFVMLNCLAEACYTKVLPEEHANHREMLHTVLEAHRTLMCLNKNNHNMFQPLVKQLEQEEQRQKQADHQLSSFQPH